jgi:hypothetical protein
VDITGDIRITGPDTSGNALQDSIVLSDGSTVEVNGGTRATLDIRAGTTGFGTPNLGSFASPPFIPLPSFTNLGTSADIRVGGTIEASGGQVLLTNQYASNGLAGDIELGAVGTDRIGPGGDVLIDAKGDLAVGAITTNSILSDGGDVKLLAHGNIATGDLTTVGGVLDSNVGGDIDVVSSGGTIDIANRTLITGSSGQGGRVRLQARGGIEANGSAITTSGDRLGGGEISFQSDGGRVDITNGLLNSASSRVMVAGLILPMGCLILHLPQDRGQGLRFLVRRELKRGIVFSILRAVPMGARLVWPVGAGSTLAPACLTLALSLRKCKTVSRAWALP